MQIYQPLNVLPAEFQRDWRASLIKATPTEYGSFELAGIRRTDPGSAEEQRIIVLVVDEDGQPIPGIKVAFAFSTAPQVILTENFLWRPPINPLKAFVTRTEGNGQIDQIQGSQVKPGEPGGITVFIFESAYASDAVAGCGMLADHTGLHLTFRLQRTGVEPLRQMVTDLREQVTALSTRVNTLEATVYQPPAEASLLRD